MSHFFPSTIKSSEKKENNLFRGTSWGLTQPVEIWDRATHALQGQGACMHPPYLHSAHAFHPWCREWGMGSNERRREDGGGVWGREGGCEPVASRGGATAGCCPVFHWLHLPWDATLWRRSSDVPSGLSQLPCARLPSSLFADIGPSHMEACLPKHCVNVIQLFFPACFPRATLFHLSCHLHLFPPPPGRQQSFIAIQMGSCVTMLVCNLRVKWVNMRGLMVRSPNGGGDEETGRERFVRSCRKGKVI